MYYSSIECGERHLSNGRSPWSWARCKIEGLMHDATVYPAVSFEHRGLAIVKPKVSDRGLTTDARLKCHGRIRGG